MHKSFAGKGPLIVMIAEDYRKRYLVRDAELGNFEESRLGIRCGLPIDLVAGKDYQIRSLAIEYGGDEGQRARISRTLVARRRGLGVAADAGPGGKMQIGNLEDLEFAVFVDVEGGLVIMHREATTD